MTVLYRLIRRYGPRLGAIFLYAVLLVSLGALVAPHLHQASSLADQWVAAYAENEAEPLLEATCPEQRSPERDELVRALSAMHKERQAPDSWERLATARLPDGGGVGIYLAGESVLVVYSRPESGCVLMVK